MTTKVWSPMSARAFGTPSANSRKRWPETQARRFDPHREISVSGQPNWQRSPHRTNRLLVFADRLDDVGPDAIDGDVQLVLTAPSVRVDRQSNDVPRHRPSGPSYMNRRASQASSQ